MVIQVLLTLLVWAPIIIAGVILVQAVVKIGNAIDRISKNLDEIATAMRSGPKQ